MWFSGCGGGGGGVVGVAFRLLKGNGFLVEGSGCGFFLVMPDRLLTCTHTLCMCLCVYYVL